MTLRQYLPLFEEVLELLKSDRNIVFICHSSDKFQREWDYHDFRDSLFSEVLLWDGCNETTRELLTICTNNASLLYGYQNRNLARIEFFTHLINKIKNA